MANNFISSTDIDEEHVMHSESDIIEIIINDEADEILKELFGSLKIRYKKVVSFSWTVILKTS